MTRVWILAITCACGPSTAPAPREPVTATPVIVVDAAPLPDAPLDHDYARLASRATTLYVEIAQAFATAGTDCAQAAAKLGELATTYADVIAANAKVVHEGRTAELRPALEPHAEQLDASAKAIVESPTMAACAKDAAFTDAFGKLVGTPP